MRNISKIGLVSIFFFFISGCGGGGASTSSNGQILPPPPSSSSAPTLSLSADLDYAAIGMTYSLNWTSENANSCAATGSWGGAKSTSGSQKFAADFVGEQVYNISCGNLSKSVTVTVLPEFTSIPDARFEFSLVNLKIDDIIDGRARTEKLLTVKDLWIESTPGDLYSASFFPNLAGGSWFGDYRILPVTNFFSDLRTPFPNGGKILDITGLENFRNLEVLSIATQNFTAINFKTFKKLKWLALSEIPLQSLDVSDLTELYFLGVTETPLTTLDIAKLTKLTQLEIQNLWPNTLPHTTKNGVRVPGMTNLDVSNQPNLLRLYCTLNRLTSLNLKNNTKLQELWASANLFASVDLSGMSNLHYIIFNNSFELTDLNIKGVAGGGVPSRLYTEGSPKLFQIKVTSVQAIEARIAQITSNTPAGQTPALGLYWDSWTALVNAP